MGENPDMVDNMPPWCFFYAKVNGETYGFDLRDMAQKYSYRAQHGEEPVMINPVTLKEFHARTRTKLARRLDALVDEGLIPKEQRVGWQAAAG